MGPDGLSQDLPGVPVHPGGQVAGHHGGPPSVHPTDRRQKVPLHRPLQSHAEQGIHTAVTGRQPGCQQPVLQIQGLQSAAGLLQLLLHGPGVRGHFGPVPHQESPHPIPPLPQQPGGGDAVPAVVPRAAEQSNPLGEVAVLGLHHSPYLVRLPLLLRGQRLATRGEHRHGHRAPDPSVRPGALHRPHQIGHRLGHLPGGVLHQLQRGDPPLLNGGPVQLSHLLCGGKHPHSSHSFQPFGSSSPSGTSGPDWDTSP